MGRRRAAGLRRVALGSRPPPPPPSSAPGSVREESRCPRGCSPPSARTFPGAREVMINSGLALSPPPPAPPPGAPWAHTLLGCPLRTHSAGRGVPARRAPLTVNSDSRPPSARRPPPLPIAGPRRSLSPARPWDSPPTACTRAGSSASPLSTPASG